MTRLSHPADAFQDAEALSGSSDFQMRAHRQRVDRILRNAELEADDEGMSSNRCIDPENSDQIQLESRDVDNLNQSIFERFEQLFAEAGLSNAVLSHQQVIPDF